MKKLVAAVIALIMVIGVMPQMASADSGYIRLAGATRYDTAIAAADVVKRQMGVDKFSNIVVASGNDYPDALSGSYLAKVKNAPVLLVGSDAVSQAKITSYINSNLQSGGTVYVLGGTGAVNSKFVSGLSCTVKRVAGSDRIGTNLAVLREAGATGEVLVCSAYGYADALSASAVGKPILLARKTLTSEQTSYLNSVSKAYIIGGTGAVNNVVANQLAKYNPTRLAGATRIDTAAAVGRQFFPSADSCVIAHSDGFADGLTGSMVAITGNMPLLLANNTMRGMSTDAINYYLQAANRGAKTLGGESLVSQDMVAKLASGEASKLVTPPENEVTEVEKTPTGIKAAIYADEITYFAKWGRIPGVVGVCNMCGDIVTCVALDIDVLDYHYGSNSKHTPEYQNLADKIKIEQQCDIKVAHNLAWEQLRAKYEPTIKARWGQNVVFKDGWREGFDLVYVQLPYVRVTTKQTGWKMADGSIERISNGKVLYTEEYSNEEFVYKQPRHVTEVIDKRTTMSTSEYPYLYKGAGSKFLYPVEFQRLYKANKLP